MKFFSVVGRALSLAGKAWLETILFAVVLIPLSWGVMEALSRGGDPRFLQLLVTIPQAIATGFSSVILYQAFDNIENKTEVELPFARLVALTVSISLATFLVNLIVSIGSSLCFIPGLLAVTGLFLTQITMFKEDTKVLASIYQSWATTDGHRLNIFILLLIVYGAGALIVFPFLGGYIFQAYESAKANGVSTAEAEIFRGVLGVSLGGLIAIGMTISRALEYVVYAELLPPVDRWLRPVTQPPTHDNEPRQLEAVLPFDVVQPPVRLPERAPIEVDPDIVFGDDANDESW